MTVIQLRVDELTNEQLDGLVRLAEGPFNPDPRAPQNVVAFCSWACWSPSTTWGIGGPILERELIETNFDESGRWCAEMEHPARADGVQRSFASGPTLLVAAMRCYVISKFGDVVDLPV